MNKRIIYLDILRIIAMFAVIIIHVSAINWYDTSINSFSWQVYNIYDSLVRFSVPIFIMISGALFLNPKKEINTITLYKKNILKIFITFIFWSLLYNLYQYRFIILDNQIFTMSNIRKFIIDLFTGYYHMWFLYVIAGLYIITPLLRSFTSNRKLLEYFLILSFILSFLINLLMYSSFISDIIASAMTRTNISFVLGYISYYCLGHYLNYYSIKDKVKKIIYILGIISIIFTITITSYISIKNNMANEFFYKNLLPNTLFLSMMIFIFIKDHFSKITLPTRSKKIITYLTSLSLGIYLIHPFVIILLEELQIVPNKFNAIISVPILVIITFICSSIITMIINKIPILKKYII